MKLSLFALRPVSRPTAPRPAESESAEHKVYCPGVGQVLEEQADGGGERIELIEVAEP